MTEIPVSFWAQHPKAIETLKTMWGKGCSVRDILTALNAKGKLTRNAIIGKAHRLKLERHSYDRKSKKKKTKKNGVHRRRLYLKPSVLKDAAEQLSYQEIKMNTAPAEAKEPIHLFDLSEGSQCHWVMGEAKAMLYCGMPVPFTAHAPYCPHHHAMMYRPANVSRERKVS